MNTRSNHTTRILRIVCAMVFLSLGFAHRTPPAIATAVQSAAYSLPDGTFADLCIADRGHGRAEMKVDCEACRLAGAVLIPEPCGGWLRSSFASLDAAVAIAESLSHHPVFQQPRSRGPPLSA